MKFYTQVKCSNWAVYELKTSVILAFVEHCFFQQPKLPNPCNTTTKQCTLFYAKILVIAHHCHIVQNISEILLIYQRGAGGGGGGGVQGLPEGPESFCIFNREICIVPLYWYFFFRFFNLHLCRYFIKYLFQYKRF